jgi:hypothetical protein
MSFLKEKYNYLELLKFFDMKELCKLTNLSKSSYRKLFEGHELSTKNQKIIDTIFEQFLIKKWMK